MASSSTRSRRKPAAPQKVTDNDMESDCDLSSQMSAKSKNEDIPKNLPAAGKVLKNGKQAVENHSKKLENGEKKKASSGTTKRKEKTLLDSDDSSDDDKKERKRSTRQRKEKAKSNGDKSKPALKKTKEDEDNSSDNDSDSDIDKEIDKLARKPKRKGRKRKDDEDESGDENNDDDENETNIKEEKKEKAKIKDRKAPETSENTRTARIEALGSSDSEEVEDADDDVDEEDCKETPVKDAKKSILDELEDRDNNEEDDDDDDDEDDDDDDSSETSDSSDSNKGKKKGMKKKKGSSDEDKSKHKKKKRRERLLDMKLSESDSDDDSEKPKSKKRGKKKKSSSSDDFEASDESNQSDKSEDMDSDDSLMFPVKKGKKRKKDSESEDLEESDGKKKKSRKRRRIKTVKNSSDEDSDSNSDKNKKKKRKKKKGSEESGPSDVDKDTPNKGRKKIRKLLSNKKLTQETRDAAREESDRRKRIKEKQKLYNNIMETVTDDQGTVKVPVTTKLVLEYDAETKEPIIQVNKDLIKKLKPHQVQAVQFLWDCCIESLEQHEKTEGDGCILAHCMGLGKSLSVITFAHTVLTHENELGLTRVLVICPLNTVLNWQNEWTKWFKKSDRVDVYEISGVKNNVNRCREIQSWFEDGGVLILGYEMFRNLSTGKNIRSKKQREMFEKYLVNPGPDVCICDEGHLLKNDASNLSKACNRIKTRRRIVLTGTPLQNNLVEYHCMLSFVKPNLLGTRKEFSNRFVNPITNGACADSTSRDVRIMKKRAHILHEMLAGCVQRRDYSALSKYLPPKMEYVILIRMTPVQISLYEKYIQELTNEDGSVGGKGSRLFQDFHKLMHVWTHPWVLRMAQIREDNKVTYDDMDSFLDDETTDESMSDFIDDSDASATTSKKKKKRGQDKKSSGDSDNEVVHEWKSRRHRDGRNKSESEEEVPAVTSQWYTDLITDEMEHQYELSGKLVLLCEVLRMAEEIGDKVLLFSQSLLSLDLIESMLAFVDEKGLETTGKGGWVRGADYFRLDGSSSSQYRQKWCDVFNDPENIRARLFLISTKAGSLGINLVAANRVIVFDASWNPSYDVQSIFRVYRFGQTKPSYIYRFLAQGTMEEKIYERQVSKLSLSQRVVDEHQIERHFNASDLAALYTFKPDRLDDDDNERPTPVLPKDLFLADLLMSKKDVIYNYHEHDSLLENIVEETLTEEERKAAWEEFEAEKRGIIQQVESPVAGGAAYHNMLNSMLQSNPGLQQHLVQLIYQQYPNITPQELTQRLRLIYQQMSSQSVSMQLAEHRRRQMLMYEQAQQQRRVQELNNMYTGNSASNVIEIPDDDQDDVHGPLMSN